MDFGAGIREERYYCAHLFRMLVEPAPPGRESGLAEFCTAAGVEPAGSGDAAAVYTEVALFRDAFFAAPDKDRFAEELYDAFVPILQPQYSGRLGTPTRPAALKELLGQIHPVQYADAVEKAELDVRDILFYREYSALFNAKPDFLLALPGWLVWIEAKYWE